MEAVNGFKVYQMSEMDWYVGRTPEEAIAALCADVLGSDDPQTSEELIADGYLDEDGPRELTEEDLDRCTVRDEDSPEAEASPDGYVTHTFREYLAVYPPDAPASFCSDC